MFSHWIILLSASVMEAVFGYPQWLYVRIRHPVVWMGACINGLDQNFNHPKLSPLVRRLFGVFSVVILLLFVLIIAHTIHLILGWPGEIIGIAALMAQRSLYNHVHDVYAALQRKELKTARENVAHIVGRDVATLDESGICRAAIESLAESFSDGVAAPLFWAAFFGLPGIACYKALNTADSMIGHKNERYRDFGWGAARLDDLANYIPARLSAALLIIAALPLKMSAKKAALCVWRDARKHASPNAGWPEAAMAGALDLCLAGPQIYDGVKYPADFIGAGTREATPSHIRRALRLYVCACGLLWLMLLLAAL